MAWHLEVVEGPDKGLMVSLGAMPLNIGRDASSSQLALSDTTVSRLHAKVTLAEGDVVSIEDLGSSHGTYLNGQKISGTVNLNPADQLKIGSNMLRLSWSAETSASIPGTPPSAVITIGREVNNNLVINEPKVSRNHARLEKHGELFYLTDLNSSHGTYLNGIPIKGTVAIAPSSWIQICGINYYFDGVNLKTEQGSIAAKFNGLPGSGFLANLSINSIKTVRPAYLAFAAALLVLAALSFLLINQGDKGGPAVLIADSNSGFQQYSHENVNISMLEGTIPEGSSVIIKSNNKPPSFGDPSILAEAYDIILPPGSFTDGVSSISMPYDASKLSRGLVAEDNIAAVYFSEQEQAWMPVSFDIDSVSNTVTMYPEHFTTYAVIYYVDGRSALGAQTSYSGLAYSAFDDEELVSIIRDLEAEKEISDKAIQVGFKSFYDTFRLEKGTITVFNTIFEPASLKIIDKKMSTIGYGVAAIKIANDLNQGKYLPALKTANTTSIGYMASKLGMKGLKIAMVGVVIIDISLGQFVEEALNVNLVKWETAYRNYYRAKQHRTAVDWYRITKKIWDESQDPEKFQQLLDAELKAYTEIVITDDNAYEELMTGYLGDTGKVGWFKAGGEGQGDQNILYQLAERYRKEIKGTTFIPVMNSLMRNLEIEARNEVAAKNLDLWNSINRNYKVTVILENHNQVKDLSDTLVNFVSQSGTIVHSQSFDEKGEVVLPMTLRGFIDNGNPTRVEVAIKEQPGGVEAFVYSDNYLLNIDRPEVQIRVPYNAKASLSIRAPNDVLNGNGLTNVKYTFEAIGVGIPDNAIYQWTINGQVGKTFLKTTSTSFKNPGDYTVECSASWLQRAADGSSYEERIAAEPIVVSIKEEVEEGTDIRQVEIDICGDWKELNSGGYGTTITNVDISKLPVGASFDMKFDAYSEPDKFIVEYEGVIVYDSGWRGNQAEYEAKPGLYPGGLSGSGGGEKLSMFEKNTEDTFVVTVIGPYSSTEWRYSIRANCPPAGE